jgi:BirA family biotin operon repressor/biotin-[acetyl-CoA-carboxylase] ligase
MVKWPNDLLIDGKKVAGILCEWCQGWLLVGVGVNVNNPIPETATRLELPLEQVHTSILAGAAAGVQDWQRDTPLAPAFADWDFLHGKQVTLQTAQGTVTGGARGVDEQGCLQLDKPYCDGHVLRWSTD